MSEPEKSPTVDQVWVWQNAWSKAADSAKRALGRARMVGLLLGVVAAALATAAAQTMALSPPAGRSLAFVSATMAGLTPLAARRSGPAAIRDWTRLRSVSEALKSEVYIYLAHVGPYRGEYAARALLEYAQRVTADADDLAYRLAAPVSAGRPLPAVVDVDSYTEIRVAGQLHDYYRPRAAFMERRVAVVRRVELMLAVTAAVLGAATGAFGVEQASAWVATITTTIAAVTAHAATARYAYQQVEFSRTAAELDRLLARRTLVDERTTQADGVFVRRCEQVISVQNEAWMAKWGVE